MVAVMPYVVEVKISPPCKHFYGLTSVKPLYLTKGGGITDEVDEARVFSSEKSAESAGRNTLSQGLGVEGCTPQPYLPLSKRLTKGAGEMREKGEEL